MKPMHRYFVHFTFTPKSGEGEGSTNSMSELENIITSIDDINSLQEDLYKTLVGKGFSIKEGTLVITNYIYVGRIV